MALQKLAASIGEKVRVHYRNESDASLPVSTSVAVHLYRIAQEAVRNANERGAATESRSILIAPSTLAMSAAVSSLLESSEHTQSKI